MKIRSYYFLIIAIAISFQFVGCGSLIGYGLSQVVEVASPKSRNIDTNELSTLSTEDKLILNLYGDTSISGTFVKISISKDADNSVIDTIITLVSVNGIKEVNTSNIRSLIVIIPLEERAENIKKGKLIIQSIGIAIDTAYIIYIVFIAKCIVTCS